MFTFDYLCLRKWQGFEKEIKETVKYLTSLETIVDDITVNKWALPYAEEYNFYDKDGEIHCIAEEKAKLVDEYPFIA